MRFYFIFALGLLASWSEASPLKEDKVLPPIDGRSVTVANVVADYLIGQIPNENVANLIRMIIDTFNKEEFDYWGNVKDQVTEVVGTYINEHNIHQLEVYQRDLEELLDRYNHAPVHSESYPDKNLQAAALSTSIISHRYLTEAAEMKESLILHFEDVASIHALILKDVAETYSTEDKASVWWKDLDDELDHYITYGEQIQKDLRSWRLAQCSCEFIPASGSCTFWEWTGHKCYETYIAHDSVTGAEEKCLQLHGSDSCSSHCELNTGHKNQEMNVFYEARVNNVLQSWKNLKAKSSVMAAKVSE